MLSNKTSVFLALFLYIPVQSASGFQESEIPLIFLKDAREEYQPEKKILVFEDSTGELPFEKILEMRSLFKRNTKEELNYGTSSSAYWFLFSVKNVTDNEWFMETGEPYTDYIDLYISTDKDSFNHIKTGLNEEAGHRLLRINQFILPLNLKKNEERVYFLRAKSHTILNLSIRISTIKYHFEVNHKEDILNGVYFGLIFALSIYNLFVFIFLKNPAYLYYVFYINFLGATISWLKGYSPEFMEWLPVAVNHGNVYASLTFVFLTLFTQSFLNLKVLAPFHRWVMLFLIIIGLISIACNLTGHFTISFNFIKFIIAINLPYIVFFGLYALKKGFRPATFYLLGFVFFTLTDILYLLEENGVIRGFDSAEYILQFGSSLEALVLSFALANKLNTYKKEKESAQIHALEQANEFSKKLILTQEEERKRIAGELHDSVGQSLSLLKNRVYLLQKNGMKRTALNELNLLISNTIQEIRSITYGLRPFQLDLLGLTESLKSLTEEVADSAEIHYVTRIDNIDGFFTKEAEINIYRIIQECLNNITKHSKATEATIEIVRNTQGVIITVEDNGTGIQSKINGRGYGLKGIEERVNILKGNLDISTHELAGTTIRMHFSHELKPA